MLQRKSNKWSNVQRSAGNICDVCGKKILESNPGGVVSVEKTTSSMKHLAWFCSLECSYKYDEARKNE